MISNENKNTEVQLIIGQIKSYFLYAGLFSAAINILMLVPIIYMLQVYDRVISSGSYSTLAMLTLLLIFLLSSLGLFEWVRSRILIAAGNRIEKTLRGRVSEVMFKIALRTGGRVSNSQPMNDLSQLRQFLTGNGIFAFFDAPWFPIYAFIMFLFHPWFGVAAIFAGIVMVCLALATDRMTSEPLKKANASANANANHINRTLQNYEIVAAMGMEQDLRKISEERADEVLHLQSEASGNAAIISNASKSFRMIMQSLLLGLGALLALNEEISPGMMIAGSLLLSRALAPIDLLVGSWKPFTVARAQYSRLVENLAAIPPEAELMQLPNPTGKITVQQLAVAPPTLNKLVLRGINFEVTPGEALGIIGPSASGKSSLARALLGIWPANSGSVRLDGADILSWNRHELGPALGYLPQDIELFDGTISENICRFGEINPEKIIQAAKLAGVHDLILNLPSGYDSRIEASGGLLSGGQRQRVGLARAVYGNPKLLVLDEPNSNLDDAGENELIASIERIKEEGSSVILISHRTKLLSVTDKILILQNGMQAAFGPRGEVLAELAKITKRDDN